MVAHSRFTGAEALALIEITKDQKRISWTKVVKELEERGFPRRTAKSVRNRHLRWRQAQNGEGGPTKNFCKKCGRPQRGHVCEIVDTELAPATP
jgi:hypothetical protein